MKQKRKYSIFRNFNLPLLMTFFTSLAISKQAQSQSQLEGVIDLEEHIDNPRTDFQETIVELNEQVQIRGDFSIVDVTQMEHHTDEVEVYDDQGNMSEAESGQQETSFTARSSANLISSDGNDLDGASIFTPLLLLGALVGGAFALRNRDSTEVNLAPTGITGIIDSVTENTSTLGNLSLGALTA